MYCKLCNIKIYEPYDHCLRCLKIKFNSIKGNLTPEEEFEELIKYEFTKYELKKHQKAAIGSVNLKSRDREIKLRQNVLDKLNKYLWDDNNLEQILEYIRYHVPLSIHINLNKYFKYLIKDTHYRNQFETSFSSGSTNLTSRKKWETNMFLRFYDNSSAFDRVKYGCINIFGCFEGVNSAKAYGKSYFTLKNSRTRITYTVGDSSNSNFSEKISSLKNPYSLLNQLSAEQLDILMKKILNIPLNVKQPGRYTEIQIHGEVRLDRDIDTLFISKSDAEYISYSEIESFCKKNNINFIYLD